MNELLDLLDALNRAMLEKIGRMKDKKYIDAVILARKKINEAEDIIALANK